MIPDGRSTGAERLGRGPLDDRPVHDRVRERDPDLDRVGSSGTDRSHNLHPVAPETTGHIGDEQLAPGVSAISESILEAAASYGRAARHCVSFRTSATSLSPRPDSVISTAEPAGIDLPGLSDDPGQGVSRFQGGDDPLGLGQQAESREHLGIVRRGILGPSDGSEMGVLGADPGVVQPGRYRACLEDLTVLVLQEPGPHPVDDTGDAIAHRGTSRRLDAHEACARCRRIPAKVPAAFEPPPTQATTTSGSKPSSS